MPPSAGRITPPDVHRVDAASSSRGVDDGPSSAIVARVANCRRGAPGDASHRVEPTQDFSGRSEIAEDLAMCPFALDPSKDARSGRAAGDALRGGRHNAGRRGAIPRRGARRQPPASMSSREICKYFLHGACRNGASCRFSHQMDAPKSTVCTYYLAGNCAYGDKCRYDHVRPKVGHASASTRAQTPRGARVPGRCARRSARPPGKDGPRAAAARRLEYD